MTFKNPAFVPGFLLLAQVLIPSPFAIKLKFALEEKMPELTLYTHPMSRGRIIRWMLEEIGTPYKSELIGYGDTMKSKAYRAINPMGKVPAITYGDTVVTECAAICAYLADTFPDAGLAPPIRQRGDYYRWLFFAAGPVEMAVAIRSMGFDIPADKLPMAGCGRFEDVMDTLEQAIARGPFIAGDAFSAADVYVGSHIAFGLRFGTIPPRPGLADYVERLQARPAFQQAQAIDDAALAALKAR